MRSLWLLLLPMMLFAQMLEVGDRIAERTIGDQFERPRTFGKQRWLVLTWDRETTGAANRYFDANRTLIDHGSAVMFVDTSTIPSGIFSMFVLPRLQAYEHPMLLSYDEAFNASLPYEEGKVTVLTMQEGKIASIDFVPDAAALAAFFAKALNPGLR